MTLLLFIRTFFFVREDVDKNLNEKSLSLASSYRPIQLKTNTPLEEEEEIKSLIFSFSSSSALMLSIRLVFTVVLNSSINLAFDVRDRLSQFSFLF